LFGFLVIINYTPYDSMRSQRVVLEKKVNYEAIKAPLDLPQKLL